MTLESFITNKTKQKTDTEVVTLRLAASTVGSIDDFSATLDVTRQELMAQLIEDSLKRGLTHYEAELNKPDSVDQLVANDDGKASASPRYFVLNTNKNNDLPDHVKMVSEGIAAAFCDPWKFKIEHLKKGDIVFLYESGVGIVGVGNANGITEKSDRGYGGDDKEDTRYQKLDNYMKVRGLSAREIKKLTGKNMRFLQTMFSITADDGALIRQNLIQL
jgi:hypothetical protein